MPDNAFRGVTMEMVRRYASVRPVTLGDAARLIVAYLLMILDTLASAGKQRETVGHFLFGSDPVHMRFRGMHYYLRPASEDIAVALQTHEILVSEWFSPQDGETVVDVGAHIGSYTIRAGVAGARVIAFEPNPDTFRILERNVRVNHLEPTTLHMVAAGDKIETRTLATPAGYFGRASLLHGHFDSGTSVACDTLDHLVPESEFPRVDWLKIDVEGFEVHVLDGASHLLGRTVRAIVEVEHSNRPAVEDAFVRAHGFELIATVTDQNFDYLLFRARPPRDAARNREPVQPPQGKSSLTPRT